MEWLGIAADVIGIAGAVFAFLAWLVSLNTARKAKLEEKRQNKKILVQLRSGSSYFDLLVPLRRSELTRAEVLGRVGMLPLKDPSKRFSIRYLNSPEFLKRLNEIIGGDGSPTLEISCDLQELQQFDVQIDKF